MKIPIGLQLYTVGKEMDADPAGTLQQVAAAGYQTVELSPLSKTPTADLKKMLANCGLNSPAGHFMLPALVANLGQSVETAHTLGLQYMVVTVPWIADVTRVQPDPGAGEMGFFLALLRSFSLDDYKWNAEQCNRLGEQLKKAGLRLGYHNHNFEFKSYGGTTGYDEFLRLTDPELVKLELDCGWMTVAGHDPIAYLKKYPDRYRLLHVKDFKQGYVPTTTLMEQAPHAPVSTELGHGSIDYKDILNTASQGQIDALFVEQEPPFSDVPALEAINIDYAYLRNLGV